MRGTEDDAVEFTALVSPHLETLQRYAARLTRPEDADDVVQDALVRAWRRRATYDAARGDLLPWLLGIVKDRARRHRGRLREHLPLLAADRAVSFAAPDLDLERALAALSDRQREAVELYYFVDLDVATVAAAMDCASGTVRATLHQARQALRDHLGETDD